MGIDLSAVRAAYYGEPLQEPLDRVPTAAELLAEYERICVWAASETGRDPGELGIREHGSLIGGPDNPFGWLPLDCEKRTRIPLVPLDWFDYPARTDRKRWIYYNLFKCMRDFEYPLLLGRALMSVYEIARAATIGECRRPFLIRRLHQFAVAPQRRCEDRADSVALHSHSFSGCLKFHKVRCQSVGPAEEN